MPNPPPHDAIPRLRRDAYALRRAGLPEAAARAFSALVESGAATAADHSVLLYLALGLDGMTPEALRRAHEDWARRHAEPLTATAASRPPPRARRDGRLKVGFFSGGFSLHPAATFLLTLLQGDRGGRIAAHLFDDTPRHDVITDTLRRRAASWTRVRGRPDAEVAALVRAAELDVLVDLDGHTNPGRVCLFALRPAPLQVAWAGYPGTTGCAEMDAVLCDHLHVPGDQDGAFTEQVVRLGHGVAWLPPVWAPPVEPPPVLTGGAPTFGSFANPVKLTDTTVAVWAEVLRAVPGSRLVLKYPGYGEAATAQAVTARFARHGIAADRLVLEDTAHHRAVLARYGGIDVALDPLGYSGGVTTLEALWMGVPVVARPGRSYAQRHAFAHCRASGLTEGVATTTRGYVERAVALATDPPRLARLRAEARGRLQASTVLDAAGFARDWIAAVERLLTARE